ncbi:MAG: anion permease, partial [Gemmatimonadota bacterium]
MTDPRPTAAPAESNQAGLRVLRLAIVIGLGVAIWFAPSPAGVTPRAWHLFAIFVSTIVGIMLQPLPMGAVA